MADTPTETWMERRRPKGIYIPRIPMLFALVTPWRGGFNNGKVKTRVQVDLVPSLTREKMIWGISNGTESETPLWLKPLVETFAR